ncbi:MAG: homogentisate 1,2-dioxygenase, partial [Gammaproteobacteria bacterium]|nr:homogentisate 1,2-dioxygenase [Gammaproteobacteria bacterium]
MTSKSVYLSGFGNEHSTEALPGALPQGQFSPQQCPYGLYTEKFSSTAFTAPRASNARTWFYRIRPSVVHGAFRRLQDKFLITAPLIDTVTPPDQLRWNPRAIPERPTD